jgi:glyoxylase-like metal-dependent hydrolase (beta-lactamase superfamily II)
VRTNITSTSRRSVLQGIAGGVACAALPTLPTSSFAAGRIAAEPVVPGLTLLRGAGGNVLALSTDDGQVVVDSGAAASSADLVATLGGLPGARVAMLLNTHWHLEQVGGNEALGSAGAKIVAHEKTRLRLATGYYLPTEDRYEKPLAKSALPTQTFYTNESASVGGRRIEYGYLIAAHTDGDIYVHFPDLNVVAVGDVVSPERDPTLDWFGGGWLGGRVDALARLLTLGDARTRFVPSYGPVIGRADVQAEHDLMLKLFELFVEHVRLGESAQDMFDAGVMDGLSRTFQDPHKFLYDAHKGFWAHHNKLMPDIV